MFLHDGQGPKTMSINQQEESLPPTFFRTTKFLVPADNRILLVLAYINNQNEEHCNPRFYPGSTPCCLFESWEFVQEGSGGCSSYYTKGGTQASAQGSWTRRARTTFSRRTKPDKARSLRKRRISSTSSEQPTLQNTSCTSESTRMRQPRKFRANIFEYLIFCVCKSRLQQVRNYPHSS
jgi:hypothetical protein